MADEIRMIRPRQFHDNELIKTPAGCVAVEIETDQTVVYPISVEMGKQLLEFGYQYDGPTSSKPSPPPEPVLGVEFAILDRSVGSLESGLGTGNYDGQLNDLLKCEVGGKNRKTAIEAIERRMGAGEE